MVTANILFVDDSLDVLEMFQKPLRGLSKGKAHTLHHSHQSSDELVAEILAQQFDLLLLDGELANGIRGYDILRELIKKRPGLLCIGFSSAPSFEKRFLEAGAIGFAQKDVSDPEGSLLRAQEVWNATGH